MDTTLRPLPFADDVENPHEELLDRVFFALSDPVRRAVLKRLSRQHLLVSELAAPFDISLQAVSRHVQVLVQAGLVQQERTGRIARCIAICGASTRFTTAPSISTGWPRTANTRSTRSTPWDSSTCPP